MTETKTNPDEYLRPEEFVKQFPNLFTRNQLRHIINTRHHNGFNCAVRRLNYRRLLIHVPTAIEWLERQKG